jgi:DNA-binding protein HU-beta
VNKQQLISNVSSKTKLSKTACSNVISALFDIMEGALKKGDKIQMVNFGTWKRMKRKARIGRNPKTGASLNIPAKNVVKFSAGQELMDSIN